MQLNIDMYQASYRSPLGILEITANDKEILAIDFVTKKNKSNRHNALIKKCIVQLEQYFAGQRKTFDLPIFIGGTDWQVRVWTELKKIGFGSVISYHDLARMSGNPRAARAVGSAVNKNRLPIIIPCHRVIGSRGDMIGYEGGLWRKKWLLQHENSFD